MSRTTTATAAASSPRLQLLLSSVFLISSTILSDNSPIVAVTAFLHPSPSSFRLVDKKKILNYKNTNNNNDINNNNNDGPIEYNDFNFEAGDDDDDYYNDDSNNDDYAADNKKSLKSRFEQVHEEKRRNDALITQNWRRGNWNVRGFSLDRYNPIDDIKNNNNEEDDDKNNDDEIIDMSHLSPVPTLNTDNNDIKNIDNDDNDDEKNNNDKVIDISHLSLVTTLNNNDDDGDNDGVRKEGEDIVVVGRTDGSVIMVEVGTQYWTKFDSKMTAKLEGDSMSVESTLVRDASRDNDMTAENDFISTPNNKNNDIPFEVLHQFTTPAKRAITSLLPIENNDDHSYTIVTGDIDGNVMIHSVSNNGDRSRANNLDKIHSNKIVALNLVSIRNEKKMIVSVSSEGTIALWNLSSGDNVYESRIEISVLQEEYNSDDTLIVHCADVYEDYLFLGLSSGHVLTYKVDEMMEQKNPIPNGKFSADSSGIAPGITAIACGGRGRLDGSSVIIVTGSADGTVKQWELLPRGRVSPTEDNNSAAATSIKDIITKIEHWPRLKNQRMSKRAHLFSPGHSNSEGTASEISSLAYNADIPSHFVSSGQDGAVRAWNSITGEELFVLDGFDSVASLCLTHDTLLTSGMKQFVCVHDFNVDINNVDKGFELEW